MDEGYHPGTLSAPKDFEERPDQPVHLHVSIYKSTHLIQIYPNLHHKVSAFITYTAKGPRPVPVFP